ncbi:MAG: alpha/beta hydrolase [Rhizobacter sp.]|nr:alpha/beta hydrolase [Bacteriovorax sp.]
MKNLSIDGTKLNFIEINPDKPQTLLFIHGNSHSLETFSKQINSDLFKDYRLICVDLPGHGDSSKNGNYSLKNFAHIMNQFIQVLELNETIIVGHSMGGHVAINLLRYYTPSGLFLFGTPPLKNPFDPNAFLVNANSKALVQNESTLIEIETLMAEMNYNGEDMARGIVDYLRTDKSLRTEIFSDIINGVNENEVALIKSFQGPVIFLLATSDGLINNEYILNEFQTTENLTLVEMPAGHSAHIEAGELFNELLADFSKNVFMKYKKTNYHIGLKPESTYEQRD